MADRSLFGRMAWTLTIVSAGYLLVPACRAPAPAPSPSTAPVATTLAPERPQEAPVVSAPAVSETPASEPAPAAPAVAGATPEPQASASASTPPSPDPAEAQRAEQQQRTIAELTAAKAKAELLSGKAYAECPDLKPGELRHPGAVNRCARLRSEAAQAVSDYERLKQQAQEAGITVQ